MENTIKAKKWSYYLLGFLAGILNGFFGAGGGLIVVPMLESARLEPKKAHATSIAIILPLSVISAGMYLFNRVGVSFQQLVSVIPLGIGGAFIGSYLLTKLKNVWLKRIFGIIMIGSAVRMLFK